MDFTIHQTTTVITPTTTGFNIDTTVGDVDFFTIGVQGPGGSAGNRVKSELLQGIKDGINTIFTTTQAIVSVIDIQLNGLGGEAYSLVDANEITLSEAPLVGDILKVIYAY